MSRLPLPAESPREQLLVVWTILLRQLAAVAEGRALPRYDFTAVPSGPAWAPLPRPVVEQEIVVEAPVERVWAMLTTPGQLNRWMARDAYVELRVGGRYSYGWREEADAYGPQRILALEPPRRLVISWLSSGAMGTVTWTLAHEGRHTRLRLVHEGLRDVPGILADYHLGWWEFLTGLRWLA